ncbi:methylated-DNA--[protein]-cysteine S-methyltransferase [Roseateles violae]|uniref:Methylated-DNA--[protein]-cysteine S-methyltransferase n=1 Tax=Roseateles violae TaxID=3058042 RepID=A0ABT8DU00_9BURK|nr:methylated-DNA--[protein]-cysteine S-methyltransferase [Pelomonas sp. PFR6]MDN3920533.1 methylated-DNA--[protein]-cysteine S-methyltransferase [Pelomonas sp. PFR6]
MKIQHHIAQHRIATPLGWLTATRSRRGISGLWFDGQKHHPGRLELPPAAPDDPLFAALERALQRYFAGHALPQDLLRELDPQGTPFQREVWRALLAIAPGGSASYGGLARQLGRPQAARALGAAVGRNPISILIPCHRVLGAGGELTAYAGGLQRKKAMLNLEGVNYKNEAV